MNICLAITDVEWSLTKDVFSLVGTAVSLVGVVAAIYFGSQGLSAWRKQLKGSSDHSLAMEALVDLFKFRDALFAARAFVFLPNAFDFGGSSISLEAQVARYVVFSDAMKDKHASVLSAKGRLEAAALGCEAAWGGGVVEPLKRLKELYRELEAAVKKLLVNANPEMTEQAKEFYCGMFKADKIIAFETADQASADFTADLIQALADMEVFLKSKLSS
ncbi:hypothetical protein [Pseudomonas sp. SR18]|uniref:hypothetical protein n=1 Tax=Pseudomonas sp. SR18 TaxID=1461074 RepID=UPI002033A633|nr:hypothetical protein [Pseudomonas sp. SR18]MCM2361542.1 hypothetical protein [Pseudomonas sp. SR18]